MPLVNAKCTNCGADLEVDPSQQAMVCKFCGSAFVVEQAINNYNITNNVTNNIQAQNVTIVNQNANNDFVIDSGKPKASNVNTPFSSNSSQKSGGCYVATCVYGSYDCPEVWTLRRYRDDCLAEKWYGRAFIRTYYAVSPTVVKLFGKTKWFRKFWRRRLDRMVDSLRIKGYDDTPYNDKTWK